MSGPDQRRHPRFTVEDVEGQVVVAEREEVALAPDRNSYSTKNMTTAAGGTDFMSGRWATITRPNCG